MQSISVFLDIGKFVDFWWKMLMSAELKGYVTWFLYFLDLLWVRYNCAKFHHCRICVTDFREGRPFCPPLISEQPWKSPSWIGLKHTYSQIIVFSSLGCWWKGFRYFHWGLLYQGWFPPWSRWSEGHPVCKISLISFIGRA